MRRWGQLIWKQLVLFYIGGMLYVACEVVFRGWSHSSMFLVGGLCFVMVGALGRGTGLPLWAWSLLGAGVITGVELVSGLIINHWLCLGVWDYSHLPLNLWGQICLYFALLWIPMAGAAAVTAGYLRCLLFSEQRPAFRLR